jgi:hypothetical protein
VSCASKVALPEIMNVVLSAFGVMLIDWIRMGETSVAFNSREEDDCVELLDLELEELDSVLSELEEPDSGFLELEDPDSELLELEEPDSELDELDFESLELEDVGSELEEFFLLTDEELADLIVLELQDLSSLGLELDELWISLDDCSIDSESSGLDMSITSPEPLPSEQAHSRSNPNQRILIFFIIKSPFLIR